MATIPTRAPTVESLQKQINDLRRELRLLQEHPREEDLPLLRRTEVVFSCHGGVFPGEVSGAYLTKDFTATVHRLDITAQSPGIGPSTYQVLVDGVGVYEGTLLAGEESVTVEDLAIEIEEFSRLQIVWPDVAEGLETVVMTFQVVAIEGEEYD